MTHVAFTCPRLLFTVGLSVTPTTARRDSTSSLERALDELGGPVQRGLRRTWFTVELADSVDAVLAIDTLSRLVKDDFDVTVESIVASAAATDLLADPAATSWAALRAEIAKDEDDEGSRYRRWRDQREPPDFSRGIVAARHYTRLLDWPVPDAIAEHRMPQGPLVLLAVTDGRIVVVDHEPFTIGSDMLCDVRIDSARPHHATIDRSVDGWRARSADPANSFAVCGNQHPQIELAPGMVIQLARPHAFIVLARR